MVLGSSVKTGPPPRRGGSYAPVSAPTGSMRSRSSGKAVTLVPKPLVVAKPSEVVTPQVKVAQAVAAKVTASLGLPQSSKKAKSLAAAVELAVMSAVPKGISVPKSTVVLNRVEGPPTRVEPVIVPYGSLAMVGGQLPNAGVSESALLEVVQVQQV